MTAPTRPMPLTPPPSRTRSAPGPSCARCSSVRPLAAAMSPPRLPWPPGGRRSCRPKYRPGPAPCPAGAAVAAAQIALSDTAPAAGQCPGDDGAQDVVGALADDHQGRVAVQPLHGELARVPVTAVHGHGLDGALHRDL